MLPGLASKLTHCVAKDDLELILLPLFNKALRLQL